MAYEQIERALVVTYEAEAAMTEAYVVVTLGTANHQAKLPGATTDLPLGVTLSSAAAGQSVPVVVDRAIVKVVANGAFSKGDPLSIAATTGRVDTGTPGTDKIIGIALEAATAAGQLVPMLLHRELA